MHLSVIIPAYNESQRITRTLTALDAFLDTKNYASEIVVVLNNCTDDTLEKLIDFEKKSKRLRHLDLGRTTGIVGNTKGIAVKEGVLSSTADFIALMDADNTTSPHELDKLFDALSGADIAIGSRWSSRETVLKQPLVRKFLGRIGNLLIQGLLLPGIKDTQCGFKLFKREAAIAAFREAKTAGWGFDIEILVLARKFGFKIKEVPINWIEPGASHLKANAYIETFKELMRIWSRS